MEGGEDAGTRNPGLSIEGRGFYLGRLMKNIHLRRYPARSPSRGRGKESLLIRRDATPHPSSLRRTAKYASYLRISGALHLTIFEQPGITDFFSSLMGLILFANPQNRHSHPSRGANFG